MGMIMYGGTVLLSFSMISLLLNKNYVLPVLVVLEMLMYSILLFYLAATTVAYSTLSMLVALLCFAACGAACGLGLLVTLGRFTGSDMVKSMRCA